MIPYHIYGHSKGDNNALPIVWLDSSDSDSYTLTGDSSPELYDGDIDEAINGGTFIDNGNGTFTVNGIGSPNPGVGVRDINASYLEVGKSYKWQVSSLVGQVRLAVYDASFVKIYDNLGGDELIFTAQTSNIKLYLSPSDGISATYDNVSIKEVQLGSELVTNGDFDTDLSWWDLYDDSGNNLLPTWDNGLAVLERVNGTNCVLRSPSDVLVIGKKYRITIDVIENNGGGRIIFGSTASDEGNYLYFNGQTGTFEADLFCKGNSTRFQIQTDLSNTIIKIDNVSVKEVLPATQDVTSIDNKGTLVGQFDLFGSVKFANNGFESWSSSDYINYDLLEPFLPSNSFTMVTTFNLQDLTSGANNNNQLFSTLKAFNENYYVISGRGVIGGNVSISAFVFLSEVFTFYVNNPLNIQTLIVGWDNVSKKMYALNTDGTYLEQEQNTDFNNNSNAVISLLGNVFNQNTGKDNPLFEFKLYDKTLTLTEMQELQIELNNKYL